MLGEHFVIYGAIQGYQSQTFSVSLKKTYILIMWALTIWFYAASWGACMVLMDSKMLKHHTTFNYP